MLRFLRSALLHMIFLALLQLLAICIGFSVPFVFWAALTFFLALLVKHVCQESGFEKLSVFLGSAALYAGALTGYVFYLVGETGSYWWFWLPVLAMFGLIVLARGLAQDEDISLWLPMGNTFLIAAIGLALVLFQAWVLLALVIFLSSLALNEKKDRDASEAARRQYQRKYKTAT